jgi:very-short-patch-repair endonuclease
VWRASIGMRYNRAEPPPDVRLAALASRQHGVVTRRQLGVLGLDHSAIARRMKMGRLHQLYRNVYAVGRTDLTTKGRYLSAVLAYGNRAVLSHRSAAVLWRICPERGRRIDVTVPSGGSRPARGEVIVHRCSLPAEHRTVLDRIPVTTPSRTIIDLADHATRRELERAIDEALYLGLDLASLQPLPGRRGAGRLAQVLEDHAHGTTRTRSDFEELLLALCDRHALPRPLVNQRILGYEVDFVWPQARLIVETDGWSAHGRRSAFERDRARDAELQVGGWRVIRITWRRLVEEPELVARQLAQLLTDELAS